MMAWKIKPALGGDRLGCEVHMDSPPISELAQPATRVRARTRAVRVISSGLTAVEQSPCWPGNASEPLAVTDWISRLTLVHRLSAT